MKKLRFAANRRRSNRSGFISYFQFPEIKNFIFIEIDIKISDYVYSLDTCNHSLKKKRKKKEKEEKNFNFQLVGVIRYHYDNNIRIK